MHSNLIASFWNSAAVLRGFQRILPQALVLTFVLIPSMATRIFRTFLCDAIELRADATRRYLQDDLTLSYRF